VLLDARLESIVVLAIVHRPHDLGEGSRHRELEQKDDRGEGARDRRQRSYRDGTPKQKVGMGPVDVDRIRALANNIREKNRERSARLVTVDRGIIGKCVDKQV
jgi:hypothetical protein